MRAPWHGGRSQAHRLAVVALLFAAPPVIATPPKIVPSNLAYVNSCLMDVDYEVTTRALPLVSVDLYLTEDHGQSWKRYGPDQDLQAPMRLEVPRDGLYGLYFVLGNQVGYSSGPPAAGDPAHRWIMVDSAAPLTQIKSASLLKGTETDPHRIVVSWAAYDDHLNPRGVALYFQVREDPGWRVICTDVNTAASRFDWTVPEEVDGTLQVKIEVTDRAGNIGSDVSDPLSVPVRALIGSAANHTQQPPNAQHMPDTTQVVNDLPRPAPAELERAHRLYELGVFYKERGDYAVAIERFLESLELDSSMTSPRYQLAEIYLTEGDYRSALDIHQSILDLRPDDRESLRGAALAAAALKRYPDALSFLDRVLSTTPADAQCWLDAGDVLVRMNRKQEAQRYWNEALKLSPSGSEVRSRAALRLKKFNADGN